MTVYSRYDVVTEMCTFNFSARKVGLVLLILTSCVLISLKMLKWLVAQNAFALKEVRFLGTRFINEDELLSLINIDTTRHIFGLDLDAIEKRASLHPLVKEARASRRIPGSIIVEVTEREPLAVLNRPATGPIPVDPEGNLLTRFPLQMLHDYPIISNLALQNDGSAPSDELSKILNFLEKMREHQFTLYSQISEISYSKKLGIYIYWAEDAIPVFWGDGQFLTKGQHLMAFIRNVWERNSAISHLEYVDLRFKDQVVVKEKVRS